MDYFSELLESYSKLKKRTFKLTYISEQEDPDQITSQTLAAAAGKTAEEPYLIPGTTGAIWQSRNGAAQGFYTFATDLSVYKKGEGRTSKVYDNPEDEGFAELRSFLTGGNEGGESEETQTQPSEEAGDEAAEQQEAEQQRLSDLAKPGGAFEERYKYNLKEIGPALDAIDNSIKTVQQACEQYGISNQPKYCKEPGRYLTGISNAGFAHKLAAGRTLVIDPETGQKLDEKEGIAPGLLNDVAENHDALMDFLGGKGDCDTITDKIGFYKDRMVVFGGNTSEGITITPNPLQYDAVEKAKKQCGIDDTGFQEIAKGGLAQNTINTIRGTFNETIFQMGVRLNAAKTEDEAKAAFAEIAVTLDKKKVQLLEIAQAYREESDVALDLGETFDRDVILEQAGIAEDPDELKNFLLRELSYQSEFINKAGASFVEDAAKVVRTGGRADANMGYETEADVPSWMGEPQRIKEGPNKGKFIVGVGQKRIKELGKVKFGEINSIERLNGISTGEIQAGENLEAGFQRKMDQTQYKGPGSDRQQAANDFMKQTEADIQRTVAPLRETQTYLDANGKIKASDPKSKLKLIGNRVKSMLGYDVLRNSALGKALFKGSGDFQDFSNEATQSKIAELVAREARMKKYKDEIESGNQAARDAMIRQVMVCGMNAKDMTQLITTDEGKTYAVPHNEVFKRICKAENSDDPSKKPTIEVKGMTCTITTPDGLSVSFNQERSYSGGKVTTRSATKISPESIEALNMLGKDQNENTLTKFLKGQMKLLEEILSSSKENLFP